MFYVMGVAHRVQARSPGSLLTESRRFFKQSLLSWIGKLQPDVLAEEHSQEALGHDRSIAQEIAFELGIEHLFCDPTQSERAQIGYKNRCQISLDLFLGPDAALPTVTLPSECV